MSSEDAQAGMLGCKRSSVVLAEDRTPWVVPAQPPCLACRCLLLQGRRSPSASSSPLTQRKQVGALVVLETEQRGWGEDRHYFSLCPSNHKLGCGAPMLWVCACVCPWHFWVSFCSGGSLWDLEILYLAGYFCLLLFCLLNCHFFSYLLIHVPYWWKGIVRIYKGGQLIPERSPSNFLKPRQNDKVHPKLLRR